MNGKKKGIVLLIAALVLALALCACGGSSGKDVPVADIVTAVDGVLGGSGNLVEADAGMVEGFMKLAEDGYADCAVKISSGTSFDEYGVFQAADSSQAKAIAGALEAYLQLKLDTDMGYQPEELPKLEKAEVKTSGNYVVYCILSDTEKSAAFSAFEDALK